MFTVYFNWTFRLHDVRFTQITPSSCKNVTVIGPAVTLQYGYMLGINGSLVFIQYHSTVVQARHMSASCPKT